MVDGDSDDLVGPLLIRSVGSGVGECKEALASEVVVGSGNTGMGTVNGAALDPASSRNPRTKTRPNTRRNKHYSPAPFSI